MALETFKAQLKAKAKTLGVTNLSNKRIDAYAATLDKQNPNLATDDDHAERVDQFLEIVDIKEVAAYDDYKATKARKDGKPEDKKDPEKKDPEKVEEPENDPAVPAWAKALIDSNKALTETVGKLQAEKTQQTMQARLKETLTDIPPRFYAKWQLPQKDEDFDPFVENVKAEWEEFSKETGATHTAAGGDTKPTHKPARGGGGGDAKATKEEVESIVNNIM